MTTLLMDRPMAEKGTKGEKSQGMSVRLPIDVVESARIVAACRNVTLTDLLGDILRPVVSKMEREEIAKRAKRDSGGK